MDQLQIYPLQHVVGTSTIASLRAAPEKACKRLHGPQSTMILSVNRRFAGYSSAYFEVHYRLVYKILE